MSASLRYADILKIHFTQSLSKANFVCFLVFCSSSVYESKLSTQPRNKKPVTSVTGFAERKGFEPSIRLPVYTLSRRAPSTTRTPLYFSFMCSSILSLYSNGSFFQLGLYFTNIAIQMDLDRRMKTGCNNMTNAIDPNIQ